MNTEMDGNIVTILRERLEAEVKRTVTEALVKKQLDAYEQELRGVIGGLLEEVAFDKIDLLRDCLKARDELTVFIKWNDKPG